MSRRHQNLFIGAKWTATPPVDSDKHFELVAVQGTEATLRCIVSKRLQVVDRKILVSGETWQKGWH